MKKIKLIVAICLVSAITQAQTITAAPGKKIQLIVTGKRTTIVKYPEQDYKRVVTSDTYIDYDVKTADGKKVDLTTKLKKYKVKIETEDGDINYDSEDPNAKPNPMVSEMVNLIDQPNDISLELGTSHEALFFFPKSIIENYALVIFLPFDKDAKVGTSFTDSTTIDNTSNFVNVYTVTKASKDEITVDVKNTASIKDTRNVGGMELKENLQVISTGTRVYDAVSGILKTETKTIKVTGTNQTVGKPLPISIEGTSTAIVK